MKILFIGGTGNISLSCTRLAVERGMDVWLLNRGKRAADLPEGVNTITADINKPEEVAAAIEGHTFDSITNWIAFTPDDIQRDVELFNGKCGQYVFISSASAYQKPVGHYLITESTPLKNPWWEYSRNKIASENAVWDAYRERGFPGVIVRPSYTYGETVLPCAVGGWDYTVVDRMRRGKKIIVHGDGTSLWVMTHSDDFAKGIVGLLGNVQSIGNAFHITSDEVLSWDQIYTAMAHAAGVEPHIIHIPSDLIRKYSQYDYDNLLGDKAHSVVFDNSKLKRLVPDFVATIPFSEGIKRSVAWFDTEESRRIVSEGANKWMDQLIADYEKTFGLD